MGNEGILYRGLEVMGGGAILGGLVLGAIAAFIIDREFVKAGTFACAGAILTFLGFMHGEKIGVAESPLMALSYLLVGGVLFICSRLAVTVPATAHEVHPAIAVAD